MSVHEEPKKYVDVCIQGQGPIMNYVSGSKREKSKKKNTCIKIISILENEFVVDV